ncbi:MAG: hypothetical protein IJ575_00970 [Selenomonadaceae bacterium]|nr:hypothetical protein [Selenomonadaceae bacterium]
MMQAQKKIEIEDFDEDYEDDLEITPALGKYLRDVEEGREEMFGPFATTEEMFEHALGKDWRKYL